MAAHSSTTTICIDKTRDCEVWRYMRRIREHEKADIVHVVFDQSWLSDLCLQKIFSALREYHGDNVVSLKFIDQQLTVKTIAQFPYFRNLTELAIHTELSERLLRQLTNSVLADNRLCAFGIHGNLDDQVSVDSMTAFLQTLGSASNIRALSLRGIYIPSECRHALGYLLQNSRALSITLIDVNVDNPWSLASYIQSSLDEDEEEEKKKLHDLTLSISPDVHDDGVRQRMLAFYMVFFENLVKIDRLQSVKFVGVDFLTSDDDDDDFSEDEERVKASIENMRSTFTTVEFVLCQFSLTYYNAFMSALCDGFRCKTLRLIEFNVVLGDDRRKTNKKMKDYHSLANAASPQRLDVVLSGTHEFAKSYLRRLCRDLYTNESITDLKLTLEKFPRDSPRALPFFSMNRHIQRIALYGQWPVDLHVFGDGETNESLKSIYCATRPRCAFVLRRFPNLEHLSLERSDVRSLEDCSQLKRLNLGLSALLDRHLPVITRNFHSLEEFSLSIYHEPTPEFLEKLRAILRGNPRLPMIICREEFLDINHVVKLQ